MAQVTSPFYDVKMNKTDRLDGHGHGHLKRKIELNPGQNHDMKVDWLVLGLNSLQMGSTNRSKSV